MKVVFIKDLEKVAKKGDEKEVKPGFARNYLLPRGFAVAADSREAKEMVNALEKDRNKKQEETKKIGEKINKEKNLKLIFQRKSNKEKLFGSIKPSDILEKLEGKIKIKPQNLTPDTPIKTIGEHHFRASFADGQLLDFVVSVTAESKKSKKQ